MFFITNETGKIYHRTEKLDQAIRFILGYCDYAEIWCGKKMVARVNGGVVVFANVDECLEKAQWG